MGTQYFGWSDAKRDSAPDLAAKFLEGFPGTASQARGWDWAYAGWYVSLLGVVEQGVVPIMDSEWGSDGIHFDTVGPKRGVTPPHGFPEPPGWAI
jgi:hypothetical protein